MWNDKSIRIQVKEYERTSLSLNICVVIGFNVPCFVEYCMCSCVGLIECVIILVQFLVGIDEMNFRTNVMRDHISTPSHWIVEFLWVNFQFYDLNMNIIKINNVSRCRKSKHIHEGNICVEYTCRLGWYCEVNAGGTVY